MKRLLIPLLAALFAALGLAESTHSHQFTEEGCCECLCPGAAAVFSDPGCGARLAAPPMPESGWSRVLPFFTQPIFAVDIFHPPAA